MKYILVLCFLTSFLFTQAQFKAPQQKTFFGIEYKPIFSSEFFTTGPNFGYEDNLTYSIQNESGSSFGMAIRHNFYGKFSFESGINIITRNYHLTLSDDTSNFYIEDDFKLVTYEIPALALVYVQTGDKTFINAGTGLSFNFLPTEVATFEPGKYSQISYREGWIKLALLAQLGFEYRSEKNGIFYLGSSFHLPFSSLANSKVVKIQEGNSPRANTDLSGRFLTLSFRYFFGPSANEKTAKR